MKILVVGDCHGNTMFLQQCFLFAEKSGITQIMQVGDLGYDWPGAKRGKQERIIEKFVERYNISFSWLDGNHENHESIIKNSEGLDKTHPVVLEGTQDKRVLYCPRGSTWEWDGVRFMAFGGAYSVDKNYRTPYLSWWPEEEATYEDLERALTAGKVDILFCHDMPEGTFNGGEHAEWKKEFPEARPNKVRLQAIIEASQPRITLHGHMHFRYTETVDYPSGHYLIEGLANEAQDALYVLDTEDYK